MNRSLVLLLFVFLIHPIQGQSPDDNQLNNKFAGSFIQIGIGDRTLENGSRYTPVIIGGEFYLPLYKTENKFNLGLRLLPQIGAVFLGDSRELEFGLNGELDFNLALNETLIVSLGIGSGPHYIGADVERQAKGFIFSDNFVSRIRKKFDAVELGFLLGFRHLSNANIKQPNGGINNFIFGLSVLHIIKKHEST